MKKGLGGTTRQTGFMAASGIYALDHMEHLKDDHQHTQMIARGNYAYVYYEAKQTTFENAMSRIVYNH